MPEVGVVSVGECDGRDESLEGVFADGSAFVPLVEAASVTGRVRLPAEVTPAEVKGELDRIGQDVNVGLGWTWVDELPKAQAPK